MTRALLALVRGVRVFAAIAVLQTLAMLACIAPIRLRLLAAVPETFFLLVGGAAVFVAAGFAETGLLKATLPDPAKDLPPEVAGKPPRRAPRVGGFADPERDRILESGIAARGRVIARREGRTTYAWVDRRGRVRKAHTKEAVEGDDVIVVYETKSSRHVLYR